MARTYTGEELIDIIQKNAGVSDTSSEGTSESDLLQYINEEIFSIYAEIATAHQEFFVVTEHMSTVAGQKKYAIPERAMFGKIRHLHGVDSDGNVYTMEQISPENLPSFGNLLVSYPQNYYIENNHIVLHPNLDSAAGKLAVSYLFRPGQLVLSTACRQVDDVNLVTGAVTLDDNAPSTWTTNLTYDFHSETSGATCKAWGLTASVVSGTGMTFTPADINGSTEGRFPVAIGDWVCEEETAAIPGLPKELHPLVAQAAICRLLEVHDQEQFKVSRAELERMIKRAHKVLAMRVEGPGQKIDLLESTFLGR